MAVSHIKNHVEAALVQAQIAGRNVNKTYTEHAMETAISQHEGKHQAYEVNMVNIIKIPLSYNWNCLNQFRGIRPRMYIEDLL